jgi:hypothetical protein
MGGGPGAGSCRDKRRVAAPVRELDCRRPTEQIERVDIMVNKMWPAEHAGVCR